MLNDKKKPRPMHFVSGYMGDTLCGKSVRHVRHTYTLFQWDNVVLAGGRRCEACRPGVEAIRAQKEGA